MRESFYTDTGTIKIHRNVIASIASLAAAEVEGVKRVGSFRKGFFALTQNSGASSIKVDIDKNEEVKIQIPLIIKYDYSVPEVASKVQDNVRNALERMTNLAIKDINVNVQGIEREE